MSDDSTSEETNQRVWDLIARIGLCMLVTRDEGTMRARPMVSHPDGENNAIRFLTNRRHHKIDEIESDPTVCLAFADAGNHYVSVTGHAAVSQDQDLIDSMWSAEENAWFDGREDPDITVLTVTPDYAEYWDRPASPGAVIRLKAAAVTGSQPDMQANRKVPM